MPAFANAMAGAVSALHSGYLVQYRRGKLFSAAD
jgi:hypothetical protein